MIRYLAGRIVSAAGVLAALVTLVFFATSVIGNPVELLADPEFTCDEEIKRLSSKLGYDRPLHERYADYLAGALRGDFGDSMVQPRRATDLVKERLPAPPPRAAASRAIVVVLALPLAIASARAPSGWLDGVVTTLSTGFASLPPFWFAIALFYIFAVALPWLPSGGYGDLRQLTLPALALAIVPLGHTVLILQAALRNEFARQYVVVARAKGLREQAIAFRHVLRNAAIVFATQIGLVIAFMNDAVLIEAVFAWPGLGQLTLESVSARDLPVVMASVIYFGVFVVAVNLVVDLSCAGLDPRVRLS